MTLKNSTRKTMADSRKTCSACFEPAPPDWNERHCPKCNGRLKLQLVKKRRVSQGRSRAPREDKPDKERKPRSIKRAKRSVRPGLFGIFAVGGKSVLGPRFHVLSPSALLIMNILSLGLRSTFWIVNRTRPLYMMARPEEKNIIAALSLWLMSFCAYFASLLLVVFTILARDTEIAAYLAESLPVRVAAAAFGISFIINRHILYWTREVIIDELRTSELDFIRSRALTFTPSPMLIWFVGVPYLQYHINRMIKKKGLNTYKPSRRVEVKKTKNVSPGLAAEA